MKQGKSSLSDLFAELDRQDENKTDLVVPVNQLSVESHNSEFHLLAPNPQSPDGFTDFGILDNAHDQIGTFLEIPKKYYQKMAQAQPNLLVNNINTWFKAGDKSRLVRGLDGSARAFLSDRYRRIENGEIAQTVLQTFSQLPFITADSFRSMEVTDRKLYIKIIFSHIQGEIKQGDIVESGIMITNSEIGRGGFQVAPFIHRLVCTNGMKVNVAGINKRHVGSRLTQGIQYQDDTIQADNRALMLELRDTLLASADQIQFNKYVDQMREATTGEKIERPVDAVEVLSQNYGLNKSERDAVLTNLIQDGDFSKWGALNAVTKVANNVSDYDRATELEETGGLILDLNRSQWHEIASAEAV